MRQWKRCPTRCRTSQASAAWPRARRRHRGAPPWPKHAQLRPRREQALRSTTTIPPPLLLCAGAPRMALCARGLLPLHGPGFVLRARLRDRGSVWRAPTPSSWPICSVRAPSICAHGGQVDGIDACARDHRPAAQVSPPPPPPPPPPARRPPPPPPPPPLSRAASGVPRSTPRPPLQAGCGQGGLPDDHRTRLSWEQLHLLPRAARAEMSVNSGHTGNMRKAAPRCPGASNGRGWLRAPGVAHVSMPKCAGFPPASVLFLHPSLQAACSRGRRAPLPRRSPLCRRPLGLVAISSRRWRWAAGLANRHCHQPHARSALGRAVRRHRAP